MEEGWDVSFETIVSVMGKGTKLFSNFFTAGQPLSRTRSE